MTVNTVKVTVAASGSPVDLASAEGYVIAVPSGTRWPDAGNDPVVPMVQRGYLGDGQNGAGAGATALLLVASDSYASGVLTWDFLINIRGFPTVNVPGCVVNYSNGAAQNAWTILTTAGWTPPSMP